MKIAIFSDSHLGVKRFKEDAERQFLSALNYIKRERPDVVLHAGDLFDSWKPSFNDLKIAIDAFKEFMKDTGIPIVIIAGNHDTTTRDMVRAVDILGSSGATITLRKEMVEVSNIKILGLSHIPNDLALPTLKSLTNRYGRADVLLIHQDIQEITRQGPTIRELKDLGHGLVVNGHIHKRYVEEGFIIPGSTVATKINEDEIEERGFVIWEDGVAKFHPIPCRKIVLERLNVEGLSIEKIEQKIREIYKWAIEQYENPYVKIQLIGKLDAGLRRSDIKAPKWPNLEIDKSWLETSLSDLVREWHEDIKKKSLSQLADEYLYSELKKHLKFLPVELLNILKEGPSKEELKKYIEGQIKRQ